MDINQIDFAALYRQHLAAIDRTPKPASSWDARAADMSQKALDSRYATQFVARVNLDAASLLDVGCGPGTIGLLLADRLQQVYGLDFSRGMLDAMLRNAAALRLDNVTALQLSWDDDWAAVPVCDIVVASRSTAVDDMAAALVKLDAKARRRVYLTSLVGGRFVDHEVAAVIGRQVPALPDYIYIINLLYRMGIHPRLDYIEHDGRFAGARNFAEFAQRVGWVMGELNADETAALRDWYAAQETPPSGAPMRWAFISWEKTPAAANDA